MSEGLMPEAFAFPRLEQVTTTPDWMRASDSEVRTVTFGEPAAPRVSVTPEPEPEPEPEIDLEAVRRELDAERAALVAERQALEAERESACAEERRSKERFVAAVAEFGETRAAIPEELEEPVIELAVGIAEILVERALETDPELHHTLAAAALAAVDRLEETTLLASRQAYDAIVEVAGQPSVRAPGGAEIQVTLEPALTGLGVVAKVGAARVDARLRERLTRVRDALVHERRLQRGEMA